MEKKLTEAFNAVHMDDHCVERIEKAMKKKTRKHIPVRPVWRTAAAACLVLVMIVAMNPTIAQAMEWTVSEAIEKIRATFQRVPGTVVVEEDYVYYNDGYIEHEHISGSSAPGSTTSLTMKHPAWLKEEDGRLIFKANTESIDITHLISMEEPFTYIYEKDGITHYLAVGGVYNPEEGLDSIAHCEWLRNTAEMEEGIANGDNYAGWLGGGNVNRYDPETGSLALWYAKAVVEMDIPWENTDAREVLEAVKAEE